ncbi:MAG: ABC transporter ATP-binding protein [Opitutales bacterium]|nr:ABC transporter ATP-binding protein [Opitutales bacterium]
MSEREYILRVKDLVIEFKTEKGIIRAVDGVSFDVRKGEPLGIVGESGCGKSVTSLSILRLIPEPPGKIASGSIELDGVDMVQLSKQEVRQMRGKTASMIFQEPMTALNPVYTVGNQMCEVIRVHQDVSKKEALQIAEDMLKTVDIESPEKRLKQYPHELSGGMRQRVMIAMALSCNPKLLIADEPTTALDVTVQAQVMEEIERIQKEREMGLILITHDLGVIAEACERVIVMYCGKIVEVAPTEELFRKPKHPYTKGLLASIPKVREEKLETLPTIEGMVPDLAELPVGCRFADRCPKVQKRCRLEEPRLDVVGTDREVSCFYPD